MKNKMLLVVCFLAGAYCCVGQSSNGSSKGDVTSNWDAPSRVDAADWHKNIFRYNLSGGLLFGINHYIVFGYERVVGPHQSFSVNIGRASLPKLVSINTDSTNVTQDKKNTGFNASVDYRFYLAKENRYNAPHGLYIGPYLSYNHFMRENDWTVQNQNSTQQAVTTKMDFDIFTIGGEMGYQFIIWKRLALDFVMIGPGTSYYSLTANITGDLTEDQREKIRNGITQIITQKFPGMNYVLSDKQLDANGRLRTWSVGYRYLIHIGFAF
jgi:Protein of unknown function (DUF3575)